MASNRISRKTAPGFADPRLPVIVGERPRSAHPLPGADGSARRVPSQSPRGKQTPLVEVEVTYERGSAPHADALRRVYEIWTNNHVYTLDPRLHCLEVRVTGTGNIVADHPFLGSRLVGGQLQDERGVEMSYPLPRPGAFAVFEARRGNRRQFSRTSVVTRVVLRLKIMTVTDPTAVPTWEAVSGD